jgi:hypothetical protein
MNKKSHLYVLWTNDNPVTAEKMRCVFLDLRTVTEMMASRS